MVCFGRPHKILRSPLKDMKQYPHVQHDLTGGKDIPMGSMSFCALRCYSGECCGKEASAEVLPTVLGPSSHYIGCAAQVEDMQLLRLFLHDVDSSVGSIVAKLPCITAGTGGPLCCPH